MKLLSKIFKKIWNNSENHSFASSPIKKDPSTIEKIKTEKGTITKIIAPGLNNGFPKEVRIIESGNIYDTGAIESIKDIPESLNQTVDIKGYECQIEYFLQRRATEEKRNGNLDIAIACLRKSNAIMAKNTNYYQKKDFLRLPEFLKQVEKFNEARKEEVKINNMFKDRDFTTSSLSRAKETLQSFRGTADNKLVHVLRDGIVCGNCAKYHDRIYSVDGKDSRFPNLDIFENYITNKKCKCALFTFPFTYGISIFRGVGADDPIAYSNRPFEDDRTDEEKRIYDDKIFKQVQEEKDRRDYDWIRENIPELAPKSFGGYRNMKNKNSTNYQKITSVAQEKGYQI